MKDEGKCGMGEVREMRGGVEWWKYGAKAG